MRIIPLFALVGTTACAAPLIEQKGSYELQVLLQGSPAPTFHHQGEAFVMGQLGERYTLRIHNRSGRRVEAVVTVDGRDVVDGKPGALHKRGYLIPAGGSVDIDGWRISHREAAAFRFSQVANSYAALTGNGRDVGVIGVALFTERYMPPPRPVYVPAPAPALRFGEESGRPPTSAAPRSPSADIETKREGLGTEYGEAVASTIHEVEFVRANANYPTALLGLRYNDHDGLVAMGVPVDGPLVCEEAELRRTAEPFPVVDRRFAAPPPGWRR